MIRQIMLFTFLSFIPAAEVMADLVVVANTNSAVSLSQEQVRSLFMGGAVSPELHPVALPLNNRTRLLFNARVLGLPKKRIQSYWAQMKFTGRSKQPRIMHSEQEVVAYLEENPDSVSYLPAEVVLPENLKVIYWASN